MRAENLQDLVPRGGSNVLPGVLQVELSLLVPELVVGDGVEVGVAEAGEDLPGVNPRDEVKHMSGALVLGQLVAPLDHLGAQTFDAVGPGRADSQALDRR